MQVSNSQDNISKLEEQIQALIIENNGLKTNNQSLSKEAEWLKIELAMSKYHCALLKHSIFGKSSEKSKASHVVYWTDLSRQIFINFASLFICRL